MSAETMGAIANSVTALLFAILHCKVYAVFHISIVCTHCSTSYVDSLYANEYFVLRVVKMFCAHRCCYCIICLQWCFLFCLRDIYRDDILRIYFFILHSGRSASCSSLFRSLTCEEKYIKEEETKHFLLPVFGITPTDFAPP